MAASMILAAVLLFAAPSGDAGPPAPAAPSDAATKVEPKKEDRVVCRSNLATGSRLRRTRVCMTEREWDAQRELQARELNRRPGSLGDDRPH